MPKQRIVHCSKQRFKGIESFLKRVAFNLGNTPSKTEVKIISCIPIDVTDLQQKIFKLEKELEIAKEMNALKFEETGPSSVPDGGREKVTDGGGTSIVETVDTPKIPEPALQRQSSVMPPYICPGKSRLQSDPTVHLALSKGVNCNNDYLYSNGSSSKQRRPTLSYIYPGYSQDCQYFPTEATDLPDPEYSFNPKTNRKHFFSKRKKSAKKNKIKTELIYYATEDNKNPFNSYRRPELPSSRNSRKEEQYKFSNSYLAHMVEKQYKPQINEYTNLSDFSTPVCRDAISLNPKKTYTGPYESDACSCCHGQYQNIDNLISRRYYNDTYPTYESIYFNDKSSYYDSNLYDLVPVKEKAFKSRYDIDIQKKRRPKKQIAKCCQETVKPKNTAPPMLINYHTMYPIREAIPIRVDEKLTPTNRMLSKLNKPQNHNNMKIIQNKIPASQISFVDFGEVYTKHVKKDRINKLSASAFKKHDASCLATPIIDVDCQTLNPQQAPDHEGKTEVTLNQIKSILQSVLTEVKTGNNLVPKQQKQDAVVQNGPSQGNMCGGSQFLQSFTYNPLHMDSYLASVSRAMPSSQFSCSNALQGHYNCMQHYPFVLQTPKHICTNCYRNSTYVAKPRSKHAASASTNTEIEYLNENNETDNLIKEIYKSMALNVEIPTKDKVKEFNNTNNNNKVSDNSDQVEHISKAVSEIFKNTQPLDSTTTRNTETTIASQLLTDSNTVSVNSQSVSTSNNYDRVEKVYLYSKKNNFSNSETTKASNMRRIYEKPQESEEQTKIVTEDDETETSNSETESEPSSAIDKPLEKKAQKGLFSRVCQIFKSKDKSSNKQNIESHHRPDVKNKFDNESESDSDDYETVYSQRVATSRPLPKVINVNYRPRPKLPQTNQTRKTTPEKSYQSPTHKEQNYGKFWDEKMVYQRNRQDRRSSSSRETAVRFGKPVYYHNYEARSALVDRSLPYSSRIGSYGPKNIYKKDNSNYARNCPSGPETYKHNIAYKYVNFNESGNGKSDNYKRYNDSSTKKSIMKPSFVTSKSAQRRTPRLAPRGLAWMKRPNFGLQCGDQWKKLILES